MRLDTSSTPNMSTGNIGSSGNVVKVRTPAGNALSVIDGDVLNVRVISSQDGNATLRTEDGNVFHARLEGGVSLEPGTEALLVVTEQADGIIYMSLAEAGSAVIQSAANQAAIDAAPDAILQQLSSMGLPVNAETVTAMQDILAAYPDMPLDQAAFIAAHKLPLDPAMLNAVSALFEEGADTASMLEALTQSASDAAAESSVMQPEANVNSQGAEKALAPNQSEAPVQTPNAEAAGRSSEAETAAQTSQSAQNGANLPGSAAASKPMDFGQWLSKLLESGAQQQQSPQATGSALSQAPAFEGLPARSLAGIAESLNSIAQSMPELENQTELFENIVQFANGLLLDPNGLAPDNVEKLRASREELYVKLAYFKDAVASSDTQSKSVLLEQTQKLMDHVRLLSSLDQFACIQLPVKLGDETRNAELYIYKKDKGGSKHIDPEDVKILLALDLAHMGHLESLIEVKGRDVSLRFDVESDEIASFFRQNTTKLHELLDESGYKFLNSTINSKKQLTSIETALLTLLSYEKQANAGLDYFV